MSVDNKRNKSTRVYKSGRLAKVVICALALALALAMAGCGSDSDSGDKEKASGDSVEKKGVAGKYVKLLTDENSTYYMEIKSDNDEQTLAQDKGKKYMTSRLNGTSQYVLGDKLYYCIDKDKTYFVTPQNNDAGEITDSYAPNSGYKETVEKKFYGEKCKCDIYEKETEEEGTNLVNVTEYYVDKDGNLVGVVSIQKNADRNMEEVSKVKMKVEKFTTKIPEGTFDLPEDYEEVKQ